MTEGQMVALFGHGQSPGAAPDAGPLLGRPYAVRPTGPLRAELARRIAAHNTATGQPADAPISDEVRARLRTELGRQWFTAEHRRAPSGGRELTDYLTAASRPGRASTAGYDLTFSPVKSVSALWALAGPELAAQIEAAHAAAVTDTINWLERHAVFTRLGAGGVRQVDVTGLIAVAFTHRDTRTGDPDLHTHVAVSNKVQTADGRWRALDGRVLHAAAVSASERYDTRLEALLSDRLGVDFTPLTAVGRATHRPEEGRPVVREIANIPPELLTLWSGRRAAITTRQQQLAAEFSTAHGRGPDVPEARRLYQQANLDTRPGKHAPRAEADQRAAWGEQAAAAIGAHGLKRVADSLRQDLARKRRWDALTEPAPGGEVAPGSPGKDTTVLPRQVANLARAATEKVEGRRATWQTHHIRAEVERQARAAGIPLARLDQTVDGAVALALSPAFAVRLAAPDDPADPTVPPCGSEPAELRRRDGASQFTVAGAQLFTSPAILAAEKRLLAAALRRDGRRLPISSLRLAIVETRAAGRPLNRGQEQLTAGLASSGARLQLALAPAGTGKTTALGVLARGWTDGGGTLIGLAPSAAAAAQLREAIGGPADTLAKLLHSLDRLGPNPLPSAKTQPGRSVLWEPFGEIGPGTLLVIDEAGMAGTLDLDRVVTFAIDRGASVRLVGDDRQLAARASGGILRDIAETAGVLTLEEIVRFDDPAEGTASLALRRGDPTGLGYYLRNGRVHTNADTNNIGSMAEAPVTGSAADLAYAAWAADRAAGLDAVLLAASNETVAALNARARADRLSARAEGRRSDRSSTAADRHVREVGLRDGTAASSGDLIVSRRNDRRLPISTTDWVKNGDRWQVEAVCPDGALAVVHLASRRHLRLPAAYVAEHVQLGYATTIHLAQGRTADTSHLVLTGGESREALYVAMTRGRIANHLYLTTLVGGDPEGGTRPDAITPPISVEQLERILARLDAQPSASTALQAGADPADRLRTAISHYLEAHTLARCVPDTARPTNPAAPSLEALPWLPELPDRTDDWGVSLARRATLIANLAYQLAHPDPTGYEGQSGTTAPPDPHLPLGPWTQQLTDRAPDLAGELRVWRAAHNVPPRDLTALGQNAPDPATAGHTSSGPSTTGTSAVASYAADLSARIRAAVGDPPTSQQRWQSLVDALDPTITADTLHWPDLAQALTRADQLGFDVPTHLHATITDSLPADQRAKWLRFRLADSCPDPEYASHAASARHATQTAATPRTSGPTYTPAPNHQQGAPRR